ncbi:hypothetical protein ACS0TY_030144 [Phlomoides rotata]
MTNHFRSLDAKGGSSEEQTNEADPVNKSRVIMDAEQSKLVNLDKVARAVIFTALINEINDLGKEYTKKDVGLRILRALPKKGWRTKITVTKDIKDLSKMTTQ